MCFHPLNTICSQIALQNHVLRRNQANPFHEASLDTVYLRCSYLVNARTLAHHYNAILHSYNVLNVSVLLHSQIRTRIPITNSTAAKIRPSLLRE